jgi:hypothetical protein
VGFFKVDEPRRNPRAVAAIAIFDFQSRIFNSPMIALPR